MKTLAIIGAIVLGAVVPARAEDLGTLEGRWSVGNTDEVRVEVPVGSLEVVATDTREVRALLTVRCRRGGRRCVERSKRLELVSSLSGQTRRIKLEGMPKFDNHGLDITLRVEVPRSLGVSAEMGVGECHIEGITRDLAVDLGVGDVEVVSRERDLRSVRLTVGIGDASFSHGKRHEAISGFLGKRVHWDEGTGSSRMSVEVGVGDIEVTAD
jgi:hypothetical protein